MASKRTGFLLLAIALQCSTSSCARVRREAVQAVGSESMGKANAVEADAGQRQGRQLPSLGALAPLAGLAAGQGMGAGGGAGYAPPPPMYAPPPPLPAYAPPPPPPAYVPPPTYAPPPPPPAYVPPTPPAPVYTPPLPAPVYMPPVPTYAPPPPVPYPKPYVKPAAGFGILLALPKVSLTEFKKFKDFRLIPKELPVAAAAAAVPYKAPPVPYVAPLPTYVPPPTPYAETPYKPVEAPYVEKPYEAPYAEIPYAAPEVPYVMPYVEKPYIPEVPIYGKPYAKKNIVEAPYPFIKEAIMKPDILGKLFQDAPELLDKFFSFPGIAERLISMLPKEK